MSIDLPRRTIAELVERYRLEPELRDIYVEGQFDKEVLNQVFARLNKTSSIVYTIGSVHIANSLLDKYKLTSGEKQRVIVLARELERVGLIGTVRCIIDKDLDHILCVCNGSAILWETDFSAMECYFWDPKEIINLVCTVAKSKIHESASLITDLESILRKLFSFRLADNSLSLSLGWIDPEKFIKISKNKLNFKADEYARRVLLKNGKGKELLQFLAQAQTAFDKLPADFRFAVRGHDLTAVLSHAVRCYGGHKSFRDPTAIERIFVLLAKKEDLTKYPLFAQAIAF